MDELIYSDTEGKYFLLDYSPSHSEMVIRRVKGKEDNIDLFFKNVQRIDINIKLTGINIFKVKRPNFLPATNSYDYRHVLKIIDNTGLTFYIEAGLFVVFHNNLELLETCLGDFTWTKENREIMACQID
jgi:hypothetical protein